MTLVCADTCVVGDEVLVHAETEVAATVLAMSVMEEWPYPRTREQVRSIGEASRGDMKLPLNYQDITRILPHRYPFLLVDALTELEPGKRVVGVKNVTINEPFFQGHFPGNPIMPGVLIVEAMAQVGGVLAHQSKPDSEEEGKPSMFFFASIDKVKFRKSVIPGDQLIIEVIPLRTGSKFWKMAGKVFVKEDLVAQAELMATIG